MKAQPYTKDDLKFGELIVQELHGLKGFDAWAQRIAQAIARARWEERGAIEAERRETNVSRSDDGQTAANEGER